MKQQESFVPYLRASNGKSLQFNIDGGSLERAHYAEHFVKHVLGLRASHSVIVRRALELYIAHLDRLLDDPTFATFGMTGEKHRLRAASQGDWGRLSEAELQMVPVVPYRQLIAARIKREFANKFKIDPNGDLDDVAEDTNE